MLMETAWPSNSSPMSHRCLQSRLRSSGVSSLLFFNRSKRTLTQIGVKIVLIELRSPDAGVDDPGLHVLGNHQTPHQPHQAHVLLATHLEIIQADVGAQPENNSASVISRGFFFQTLEPVIPTSGVPNNGIICLRLGENKSKYHIKRVGTILPQNLDGRIINILYQVSMCAAHLESQVTRPGLRSLSITASARLFLISSSQAWLSLSWVVTGTGR